MVNMSDIPTGRLQPNEGVWGMERAAHFFWIDRSWGDAFMLKTTHSVRIRAEQTTRRLAGIIVSLVLLCIVAQGLRFVGGYDVALGFVPQFALGMEYNIPTYFSALLLLSAAVLLAVITMAKRQQERERTFQWSLLAAIFFYLSVDEAAGLHELLNYPMSLVTETSGLLYYGWVLPVLVAVFVFAVAYLRFLFDLPQTVRMLFAVAGVLYVGGALGMEMVGGLYADTYGAGNPTYATLATIEETLEMTGALVFVYALLRYARDEVEELHITFA